ncbi:MAG: LytR/AlgR family response regulator transcription factor [Syntrophothermus sp.]
MNIRTIIIDDEQPARDLIRHYLGQHADIDILGEFPDGFSGAKAIQDLKPDLAFLDIQMPKITGFEMLELIEDPPVVIFSTAYDQYAIKAFELNAVDYLLKPYSKERFDQALEKAKTKVKDKIPFTKNLQAVISSVDEKGEYLQRIAVKSRHKIDVIPVSEIIYIQAEDDYVMIHTATNKYLKEKTMKYFETHLEQGKFIRIHRSYIVNADFIARLELYDKENYAVIMKNGASLKASINGYKILKDNLHL